MSTSSVAVRDSLKVALGPTAASLDVEELEGRVVVRGRVRSYYAKQLVTHAALPAAGGLRVENDVRVNAAA